QRPPGEGRRDMDQRAKDGPLHLQAGLLLDDGRQPAPLAGFAFLGLRALRPRGGQGRAGVAHRRSREGRLPGRHPVEAPLHPGEMSAAKPAGRLAEWGLALLIALVLLALFQAFVLQWVTVRGTSMYATLLPGDLVAVQRWPRWTGL